MIQAVAALHHTLEAFTGTLSCRTYPFHNLRLRCYSNQPAMLALCDQLWAGFPASVPPRGDLSLYLCCYPHEQDFSLTQPDDAIRYDELQLVTQTRCTLMTSTDERIEYQIYAAQPSINAPVVSIIDKGQHCALIQMVALEHYKLTFLKRYVLLLALGTLLREYGFVPCHAAALATPDEPPTGALILGASGSGKSTLSTACALHGCGLLGDDLILLRQHENGLIYAHTLSTEVSLRASTLELWPALSHLQALPTDWRDKRYCDIEQLRPGATRYAVPVHLLFFPQLIERKGKAASGYALLPLSSSATLQRLLIECVSSVPGQRITCSIQAQQAFLFALLSTLVEQVQGYDLLITRGDRQTPRLVYTLLTRYRHA